MEELKERKIERKEINPLFLIQSPEFRRREKKKDIRYQEPIHHLGRRQ
jgi:hypothetical protein